MQFVEQANKHHPTINLWLKFQKLKRHLWIQTFVKGKDLETIQFTVSTSNLLKHFDIRNSLHATHQGSK